MERLIELAKKRGCEAAEVYFSATTRTPVEYEFGRLKQIQTTENAVIALRVIKDGRLGFATSTKEGDYGTLVDNAVATAELGTKVEFGFAAPAEMPKVNSYDRAVVDLQLERMVATGDEMVAAIKAYEPKINAMAQVAKILSQARVLTSLGLDANYRSTAYELFAGGELVEGDNFLMCYDFDGAAGLSGDAHAVIESALEKFRRARVNREIVSGKYPVILTPMGLEQCFGP
jgi:PmbA protein